MNPITIPALATGLSVAGATIGLPSFAVLLLWSLRAIRARLAADQASSTSFGDNPDAILLMLKGITATMGTLARFAGSLGQFLFNGLALFAAVGLVLGLTCWFTGRGLTAQAHWARVGAFILIALALVPSLLLALSFRNAGRVLLLAVAILCALGLRTLWLGYPPPVL